MTVQDLIQQTIGFGGQWKDEHTFRVDALTYGYLAPIHRVEVADGGIQIISSPITNTEWWRHFIPVNSCPRYKGQKVVIEDRFDAACQAGQCEEACGAEDGFVDLSAARLRLIEDAEYVAQLYPRLQRFLDRAIGLIEQTNAEMQVGIGLDLSSSAIALYSRVSPDPELLGRHFQAFKKLYPELTDIHGKIDTSALPPPAEFEGEDEDDLIQEAKYYALKEAVKLETVDILHYLMAKKGGFREEDRFHLPNDKIEYAFSPTRIEAYREGLYMGNAGYEKGIRELQQFFATTLGGGRW